MVALGAGSGELDPAIAMSKLRFSISQFGIEISDFGFEISELKFEIKNQFSLPYGAGAARFAEIFANSKMNT